MLYDPLTVCRLHFSNLLTAHSLLECSRAIIAVEFLAKTVIVNGFSVLETWKEADKSSRKCFFSFEDHKSRITRTSVLVFASLAPLSMRKAFFFVLFSKFLVKDELVVLGKVSIIHFGRWRTLPKLLESQYAGKFLGFLYGNFLGFA
jgi:hypothetical protein